MNSLSLPHLQNTHLNTRLPTRIMSISDIKIYLNLHLSLQIQFRLRQDLHTCLIRLLRQIPSSAHDETIRPNGHFERSTSTLADSILLPPYLNRQSYTCLHGLWSYRKNRNTILGIAPLLYADFIQS